MTSRGRSSADAVLVRLAAVSRLIADQLTTAWPAARTALGEDAERWLALAGDLAERTTATAPLVFLRIDPARVRRLGLDTLAEWVGSARALGADSPSLATAFVEATAPLLGDVDAATIAVAADVAATLRADGGWRGERVALAFLAALGGAVRVLDAGELARWGTLAPALRAGLDDGLYFRALPAAVARWTGAERAAWLDAVATLARRHVPAAVLYYRDLPATLAELPAPVRATLLAVLRDAAAGALPSDVASIVPTVATLVLAVPRDDRTVALELAGRVASDFPPGVAPLLRALPRLFEDGTRDRLEPWVAHGLGIAAENADAGRAYFALESRTSVAVLRASPVSVALEEAQGVLRKIVQMLSGTPATPRPIGRFTLRAPAEGDARDRTIALPSAIDVLDAWEDNRRLYGVLAALLAGRRAHGTYANAAVLARLAADDRPPFLDELFLVAETYRVAHRAAAEYPGVAAEIAWACRRLLAVWERQTDPGPVVLFDAVAALALDARGAERPVAPWLAATAVVVLPALRPLAGATATVADALAVAERLAPAFGHLVSPLTITDAEALDFLPLMFDAASDEAPFAPGLEMDTEGAMPVPPKDSTDRPPDELLRELQVLLDDRQAGDGSGVELSPEELRRLLESGLLKDLTQGTADDLDASGLYVTQLLGKLLGDRRELKRIGAEGVGQRRAARVRTPADESPVFLYDEWDHVIGDYRADWCQLREIAVTDDAGVFFEQALTRNADLVPDLRRVFQQVRPERYRNVRGLEDGENIDWNAAVEARVERRVRGTSSTKLYTARHRQEREVATLFLLDMSASTDEAAAGSATGERIIDIAKDALVIMASALEEIGDTYAIYGFSGQGRDRVEVYPVKSFGERLSPAVKGRLGGIEPKGSTRMGTALRHATGLMRDLPAPSQHLVLLSDGFPQDLDYGDDRQSHVYGIRDTATAMRETRAAGIKPFCITVDLAGHDYLREMCDPDAYVVIERVADLPRELPRIYQRLVRAA
jgi:hypothetical protein